MRSSSAFAAVWSMLPARWPSGWYRRGLPDQLLFLAPHLHDLPWQAARLRDDHAHAMMHESPPVMLITAA
jgi:hypothetical protein